MMEQLFAMFEEVMWPQCNCPIYLYFLTALGDFCDNLAVVVANKNDIYTN